MCARTLVDSGSHMFPSKIFSGLLTDLYADRGGGLLTHPYLKHSLFLAVNRKSKNPAPSLSLPVWAQPLYVLERRNGDLFCAACTLQNGTLLIRPCTATSGNVLRLRNRIDAEFLGKVVAVVRRVNL